MQPDTLFRPDVAASACGELTPLYFLALSVAGAFVCLTYFACYFPQLRRLNRIRRQVGGRD
jgi:hypothetical protein